MESSKSFPTVVVTMALLRLQVRMPTRSAKVTLSATRVAASASKGPLERSPGVEGDVLLYPANPPYATLMALTRILPRGSPIEDRVVTLTCEAADGRHASMEVDVLKVLDEENFFIKESQAPATPHLAPMMVCVQRRATTLVATWVLVAANWEVPEQRTSVPIVAEQRNRQRSEGRRKTHEDEVDASSLRRMRQIVAIPAAIAEAIVVYGLLDTPPSAMEFDQAVSLVHTVERWQCRPEVMPTTISAALTLAVANSERDLHNALSLRRDSSEVSALEGQLATLGRSLAQLDGEQHRRDVVAEVTELLIRIDEVQAKIAALQHDISVAVESRHPNVAKDFQCIEDRLFKDMESGRLRCVADALEAVMNDERYSLENV